jgi:hypothetical protein
MRMELIFLFVAGAVGVGFLVARLMRRRNGR